RNRKPQGECPARTGPEHFYTNAPSHMHGARFPGQHSSHGPRVNSRPVTGDGMKQISLAERKAFGMSLRHRYLDAKIHTTTIVERDCPARCVNPLKLTCRNPSGACDPTGLLRKLRGNTCRIESTIRLRR